VVTVDFLAPILIEFPRRAEPAIARLAAYSYVVQGHGDSASSSVRVAFKTMVHHNDNANGVNYRRFLAFPTHTRPKSSIRVRYRRNPNCRFSVECLKVVSKFYS
jgi:hypothetical protein